MKKNDLSTCIKSINLSSINKNRINLLKAFLLGRFPFYLTPFPSPNGEGCPKDGVR